MKNVPTASRIVDYARSPVLNFARCRTARRCLKTTWVFLQRWCHGLMTMSTAEHWHMRTTVDTSTPPSRGNAKLQGEKRDFRTIQQAGAR